MVDKSDKIRFIGSALFDEGFFCGQEVFAFRQWLLLGKLNALGSLARAAGEPGILYNAGEGGLHGDFYRYGKNTVVQVASGRFAFTPTV